MIQLYTITEHYSPCAVMLKELRHMKTNNCKTGSLPENTAKAFGSIKALRTYEKNSSIYTQGENANYFYYLKKGRVRIFITSQNGGEKTLSIVGSGNIFGEAAFFDCQPRMSCAAAITQCQIAAITRDMLISIIKSSPETAMELFRIQAQTIRMLSSQLDSATFINAKGRIAQFLLEAAVSGAGDKIQATHEEIAAAVGASRVTVSRLLTQLADEGIIKTGYKTVTVISRSALKELCTQHYFSKTAAFFPN